MQRDRHWRIAMQRCRHIECLQADDMRQHDAKADQGAASGAMPAPLRGRNCKPGGSGNGGDKERAGNDSRL